jgi:hypothetical protein
LKTAIAQIADPGRALPVVIEEIDEEDASARVIAAR